MIADTAELTNSSSRELARRIAQGELSSREVVDAHIRRIESIDGRLNALPVRLFDQARAAADAADARRLRGEPLGPLHGVPVTIKELFDVAGTPTTCGLTTRAGQFAAADSPLVARLRGAGAIVLGKTNVPQFGVMYETDNPLYGRTNNPWNLDRSSGGSSGGEAALISAGGSPLGLGSDGGGSIRSPAHFCGLHGLKPTAGRLTLAGHAMFPNFPIHWVQPGPMARSVADLALAMEVLTAPSGDGDVGDAAVPQSRWQDVAAISLEKLRIGVYDDDGFFAASPAIRRVVGEATAALRGRGASVEAFTPPDVAEACRIYFATFMADGMATMKRSAAGGPRDWRIRRLFRSAMPPAMLRPMLAWLLDRLGRRYESRMLRALRRPKLSIQEYGRLQEEQNEYGRGFLAAIDAQRLDAIVCPPFGLPALRHGQWHTTFAGSYALLYNLLGMPAGTVAASQVGPGEESDRQLSRDPVIRAAMAVEDGSAGLPVGVQVVARHWREDVALAVMAALEEHFRSQRYYPACPPM